MNVTELDNYLHTQVLEDGSYVDVYMHGHRIEIGDRAVTVLVSYDDPTLVYWDVFNRETDELEDWRELGEASVGSYNPEKTT